MSDLIDRQAAIDALDKRFDDVPMELTTEILQLRHDLRERIPSVQPATNCSEIPNGSDDTISRRAAINALKEAFNPSIVNFVKAKIAIDKLPSAQPEIIHCGECIYYDPPHVEKGDARYEYSEMPKEAFDVLGTGLVSMEYGINIGGRCCVDYYCKSYSDDKRVYVRENNYCGRAERRTDG